MVSISRAEKTSANISTKSARALAVVGLVLLPPRRERSSTHVMSMPTCGVDGWGVDEGVGVTKRVVLAGSSDCGMVVPASATRDAWWLTLNSMLGMVRGELFDKVNEGM